MTFRLFLILLVSIILSACSDSDDYLFESEVSSIEIETKITTSYSGGDVRIGQDTLSTNDTILFSAEILPSNSIKLQEYFWTLDGKIVSHDFYYRAAVKKTGPHLMVFSLIDYFGDIISDTIPFWISQNPVLDTSSYLPQNNTHSIDFLGGVPFTWNLLNKDSSTTTFYQFTLKDSNNGASEKVLVDTILSSSIFSYHEKLNPLTRYDWTVHAINEYGFMSEDTIKGLFFTKGINGESGLQVSYKTNVVDGFVPIRTEIFNSKGESVFSRVDSAVSNNAFTVAPLLSGKYKVKISASGRSGFTQDSTSVVLLPDEIYESAQMTIKDTLPPEFSWVHPSKGESKSDTISFAKELKFLVHNAHVSDYNPKNNWDNYAVILLESKSITAKTITPGTKAEEDTLTVFLSDIDKNWNFKPLKITIMDNCGNKRTRDFMIRPAISWYSTNFSTAVHQKDGLKVLVEDKNPYGFVPQDFQYQLGSDGVFETIEFSESTTLEFEIPSTSLVLGETDVTARIQYSNGIVQESYWALTVEE